jgi:hypothetical protein
MRSPLLSNLFTQFAISSLIVCGLLAPLSAQDFEIKLVRPAKVGERYGVQSKGSQEQHLTVTIAGKAAPPQDQVMSAALTAKAEVLAVSPKGREIKTRFTVVKMTKMTGGRTDDVLPAGAVIVGERADAKTEFTVDGKPAASDVAQLLGLVISLENDHGADDDTIFGTKERKKVGDTWHVNAAAAAADLAKSEGMTVDAANISGTVALAEQVKDNLKITGALDMKQVAFPLPAGMHVTSSDLKASFSGLFPVDVAKSAASMSMGMDGKLECAGKIGEQDAAMVMIIKRSRDTAFTAP